MELYRSLYEAYPFLSDSGGDLRCDFELLTDEPPDCSAPRQTTKP